MTGQWLHVHRGDAPLVVAFPHVGTNLADVSLSFRSRWKATLDTDWYVDRLYAHAATLGATLIRTDVSRSVIDVNRDPSGKSLYPGQNTTDLCPITTFDGDALYVSEVPDSKEIARRRRAWFDPYHDALRSELARLQALHERVVLYDAHSIRSRIPRLFEGELPLFNIGTFDGASCAAEITEAIAGICSASGQGYVVNGRFRGGWTTRSHGRPAQGVHAVQMELAMRSYLCEPAILTRENWPPPFDPAFSSITSAILQGILAMCIELACRGKLDS